MAVGRHWPSGVDDDENDDYQWLRDEESALGLGCIHHPVDDISSRQTRCTFQKMRLLHTVLMMALMMAMTKMTAVMISRKIKVTVLLDVVLANDSVEISQNEPSFCSSLYRSKPLVWLFETM